MFFVLYASIMDDRMIQGRNKTEDPGEDNLTFNKVGALHQTPSLLV